MRVAELPGLRRVLRLRRVEYVVATVKRSAVVRERLRFVARALLAGGAAAYRLREAPLTALVRHRTPDLVTLDEVFLTRDYRFPPAVTFRRRNSAARSSKCAARRRRRACWISTCALRWRTSRWSR